uniref:Uncharacterized protein n=1 Tax=Phlebotomus papatasi TaxID=29031 RepID=A0A1B0D644_PHLPP
MKSLLYKLFLYLCVFCFTSGNNHYYVEEVYKWNKIEFENLPKSENSYVGPYRYYIPENNDVMGMGYHPGSGLMLITVSRLRPGIPSSLAAFCVSDYELGSSPKIWGFPNYEINALKESDFDGGPEESKEKRYWYRPNNNTHEYRSLEIKSEFHHVYEKPSWLSLAVPSPAPINPNHSPRLISVYHIQEYCRFMEQKHTSSKILHL